MNKTKPTISVIVAAHSEGRIIHHTLRSLERALCLLDQHQISHEVIVTLDNPTVTTTHYFASRSDAPYRVYTVDFKDLAASRNFGVKKASGHYIATLDGDDLISENWLYEAFSLLDQHSGQAVVHTKYSVNFGAQNIIWEKFDSRTKAEDALIMTQANRWDSAVMAAREVFEQFPYQPNTNGFGSEDWHFNSQTLAANIPHLVAPQTVLFVRRKDVSEMTIQAQDRRTVHYTNLLAFDFMRTVQSAAYGQRSDTTVPVRPGLLTTKRLLRATYVTTSGLPVVGPAAKRLAGRLKRRSEQSIHARFPQWLLTEWRAIHLFDKEIFPSHELLQTIPIYHSEMYELGAFYQRLVAATTGQPDYLIFVPYLTKGGADLVAINYANTLRRLHPDWHIAVIATEGKPSPWAERLDSAIDFVPFGHLAAGLPERLQLDILARFVVQSQAKRLHIIQSGLAFRFATLYHTLLHNNDYRVYAAAFCEDKDNEGRIAGHIHSGLPAAYDSIDKVFTDNSSITRLLVDEYAFDSKKFITHYQPFTPLSKWLPAPHRPLRLLWAGRIAKQKRPDILVDIARQLDPQACQIDVYGSFQEGLSPALFENLFNVRYKGPFNNGLLTLPLGDYDAYLYTSENDGLPNVLLEVASFGLPIIAPAVGGIGEFVENNTSGKLITPNTASEYVTAISSLIHNPATLQTLSRGALQKLSDQHSPEGFERQLHRDIA